MDGTNATGHEHLPSTGSFIAIICFSCVCIIAGILGNAGVVVYNVSMNHSKTPTTYFVVNLAISDILVCLAYFPPWIFEYISMLTNHHDDGHETICKIGMAASFTSISLSIANLLAINIDRLIYISKPLKYPWIVTWKRTYIFSILIWFLTIVNASVVYFNAKGIPGHGQSIFCTVVNQSLETFLVIFNIYLPFIGVFFLNYKIYKVAKSQRRKIRGENCPVGTQNGVGRRKHLQQMKMIKTFTIVLGVLIAFILPLLIITIIRRYICKGFCVPSTVVMFFSALVVLNSVINPIIYSARDKGYRIVYRRLFAKICGR